MEYYSWEAQRWAEAGCLELPDRNSREFWEPIPSAIEEEAWKKYRQYQDRQDALRREEEERQRRLEWKINHSMELFMQAPVLCVYDPAGGISSGELYSCYRQWCLREEIPSHPPRAFYLHVKKNAAKYRLVYSGSILNSEGRRGRGFRGIRLLAAAERGNG